MQYHDPSTGRWDGTFSWQDAQRPRAGAASTQDFAYVGNLGAGNGVLAVFNTSLGDQVATVKVIDAATLRVVGTFTPDTTAGASYYEDGIALSPNGKILYEMYGTNQYSYVVEFDTATGTIKHKVMLPGYYHYFAVSPDGTRLYVTGLDSEPGVGGTGYFAVVAASTGAVLETSVVGPNPSGVVLDAAGDTAYVSDLDINALFAISTSTGQTTRVIGTIGGANSETLFDGDMYLPLFTDSELDVVSVTDQYYGGVTPYTVGINPTSVALVALTS